MTLLSTYPGGFTVDSVRQQRTKHCRKLTEVRKRMQDYHQQITPKASNAKVQDIYLTPDLSTLFSDFKTTPTLWILPMRTLHEQELLK